MKNIRIIAISVVLMNFIHCRAQTYPLNTDYENIPSYSYIKDLNNELNSYIGIYKAIYQGNETTLYITKVEHILKERTTKTYYMDAIVVRYTVKNSSGTVLQDTQNNLNNKFYSIRTFPQENIVALYYPGTNCGVGYGTVYLSKINPNQIKWIYRPEGRIFVNKDEECPGNPDTKVYLPVTEDLIFTKQ
ncbi:DUF6705 family protein [Chryseobacterium mulctrae]|uniref:DUF6705 family protein n=1 Tax=Chryseobacterium mulctrae TaxID=2576777 RepID=UPI001116ED59|nr:DUF6705 family protein [Chryseobacterium mulctrae]